MFREVSSGYGAVGKGVPSRAVTGPLRRKGTVALTVLLLLMLAFPAGKLLAQSAPAENPLGSSAESPNSAVAAKPAEAANPSAQSTATPAPAENTTPGAQNRANSPPNQTAPASPASAPAVVLPPAMASKTKVPAESTYDEVHVKPMVKSEDTAKFDPNSAASAESEVDPSLRTHTKPIRVDVDLVLVPVTITDQMNRLVTGLEKENFNLLDNGEKQAIQYFSSEDAPISLGVIFDMSGSMSNKIEKSREAVVQFLKTANPEDEFFMIAFNDKPTLISDFTSNVEAGAATTPVCTAPKGRTALLDAIYLGMDKDAASEASEESVADHFRWWRQPQPLHRKRDQVDGAGSRCPDLCHWDFRPKPAQR